MKNEYDAAISYGESCIPRAHEDNLQHVLTDVYFFLGKSFFSLNRYDEAINYCKKCIDTAKQNGNKSREMEGHLLLANVFYEHKRYGDAIVQCNQCINNAKQEDDKLCKNGGSFFCWKISVRSKMLRRCEQEFQGMHQNSTRYRLLDA